MRFIFDGFWNNVILVNEHNDPIARMSLTEFTKACGLEAAREVLRTAQR